VARVANSPTESQEQQAVVQWARLASIKEPRLKYLHAIPNGGVRNIVTATILKREGVLKGIPDLFLPVSNHGKHGLYIEMKAKKGKLSEEQRECHKYLIAMGYQVNVCYSAEEAIIALKCYLSFMGAVR
jgi:hypothetical protein